VKYEETKADTSKKVHSYTGAGSFEVEICEDWEQLQEAPRPSRPTRAKASLGGTFGGRQVQIQDRAPRTSGTTRPTDVDYVESIEFYSSDDVTCQQPLGRLEEGGLLHPPLHRRRQQQTEADRHHPARPTPSFSKPAPAPGRQGNDGLDQVVRRKRADVHAWVQFDKLDFKGGAIIKGVAFAESGPDAKAGKRPARSAGKFEAKVCSSAF